MSYALVRVGSRLMAGLVSESTSDVLRISLHGVVENGVIARSLPCMISVHSSLVVDESSDLPLVGETLSEGLSFDDILHESIMPWVISGNERQIGERTIVAYQRRNHQLAVRDGGTVSWISIAEAFADLHFAQALAVEAHSGLIERLGIGTESFRGCHVYMKADPFRDITLIREGVGTKVLGYYKGCLVLEADGEEFWRPVENEGPTKDDHYYFTMDGDRDGLPDPLTSLPSKVALSGRAWFPPQDANYNSQPDLTRVAGNFAPVKNIRNDDYAILGEGYTANLVFHFDYPNSYPVKHPVPPAEENPDLRDYVRDAERRTRNKLDAVGPDSVPPEYDGEYDEPPVGPDIAIDELLAGADLSEFFDSDWEVGDVEAERDKLFGEFFG